MPVIASASTHGLVGYVKVEALWIELLSYPATDSLVLFMLQIEPLIYPTEWTDWFVIPRRRLVPGYLRYRFQGRPRRRRLKRRRRSCIRRSPSLRTALKAARTPWDEQMERAASILVREGIDAATLTADHRLALAEAFEKTHAGLLPSAVLRRQYYQLLRDYGLYRQAARLLEAWRRMVPADSPDETTILIKLAACQRHIDQIALAHETSDLLVMRSKTLPSGTKAVFAGERAAILLDLFERDHDPARLIEARRWAGIAWSIDQSDHVSKIYRRLTSLETDR